MMKPTRMFLALLLLCTGIAQGASEQDTLFSFAHVTDTHIGNETAKEDLLRTVADINSLSSIEFVIISGDITEFGSDDELKLADSILKTLQKPWYIIPGNHDTKWSESGCNSFRTIFGGETFSFRHKGFWFLGTNSGPNMRMGPGQVPRENIVWLEEELKREQNKNVPVIYVNHYPQDSSLNNWYEAIDRLKGRNVKAFLCGHGHANRAFDVEGVPAVMGRSNLRAKKAVGGYNIVSIVGDTMVYNERTPGLETRPSWYKTALHVKEMPVWMKDPPRPQFDMNAAFPRVKEKWSIMEKGDMGSAVAVSGGKVIYTNTNGQIKAADIRNGKPVWEFATGGKIYSTPLVSGKYVVVPSTDGNVYCLALGTGKLQWKKSTGKAIVSSPALYKGMAIIAGSDGHCRAWDIATGSQRWDFDSVRNFVETRPLVHMDKIYFGSWGNDFYALDAATGKRAWTWNNGSSNRMFSPAACWPVAANDKVFIVAPDRYMTALEANTGKALWRVRDTANWVRESMGLSADGKTVYAKTMQGALIAYDSQSPEQRIIWKSPVEMGYEICPSPITEAGGIVYVAGQSGIVYALSAKDGSLVWRHKFSNCLVNTVQAIEGAGVIASSADGKLVCLEVGR